jgi:RNA polymerase sigma factor (sigma-70 family)
MTFEEFAADRLPAIVVFAGVLTGDRAVAEDVVQEVLIRAHRRWPKIGALDYPERYVRKMIVNQFLSWRRGSWRDVPSGSGTDVEDRRSPDHADRHAERDALLAELKKLPGKQRAVIVLRRIRHADPRLPALPLRTACPGHQIGAFLSEMIVTSQ